MTIITKDQLNDDQKEVIKIALDAVKSRGRQHVTINGPAGTGKTTVTRILLHEIMGLGIKGVMLACPTHQAKRVLSEMSGKQAQTIHSLLKISPINYEDQVIFDQQDVPDLSKCNVLICDEASMYDHKLFQLALNGVPPSCTIIALGDIAQLRPVAPGETEGLVSPFFTHKRFKQANLTKVMRSNAPIIEIATKIREGEWIDECIDENGNGVHHLESTRDLLITYLKHIKSPDDLLNNRILAYTNANVDKLNEIIRKKIYKTEAPFVKNEIIVMQEPYIKKEKNGEGMTEQITIFNNSELIRVLDISYEQYSPKIASVKNGEQIDIVRLLVKSLDDENQVGEQWIEVIPEKVEQYKLLDFLKESASIIRTSPNSKTLWRHWWNVKQKFVKVRALPASTIHKSQGTTVDNAYVYTTCMHKASDPELITQLLYVATTRARSNVYYV